MSYLDSYFDDLRYETTFDNADRDASQVSLEFSLQTPKAKRVQPDAKVFDPADDRFEVCLLQSPSMPHCLSTGCIVWRPRRIDAPYPRGAVWLARRDPPQPASLGAPSPPLSSEALSSEASSSESERDFDASDDDDSNGEEDRGRDTLDVDSEGDDEGGDSNAADALVTERVELEELEEAGGRFEEEEAHPRFDDKNSELDAQGDDDEGCGMNEEDQNKAGAIEIESDDEADSEVKNDAFVDAPLQPLPVHNSAQGPSFVSQSIPLSNEDALAAPQPWFGYSNRVAQGTYSNAEYYRSLSGEEHDSESAKEDRYSQTTDDDDDEYAPGPSHLPATRRSRKRKARASVPDDEEEEYTPVIKRRRTTSGAVGKGEAEARAEPSDEEDVVAHAGPRFHQYGPDDFRCAFPGCYKVLYTDGGIGRHYKVDHINNKAQKPCPAGCGQLLSASRKEVVVKHLTKLSERTGRPACRADPAQIEAALAGMH
ncbi:hypothetical protein DFH06DRAFT_1348754 [Mycena polygramma]|nr:hypothetical protein DFH06DRAFT_1348754 [Mycena polygramma]